MNRAREARGWFTASALLLGTASWLLTPLLTAHTPTINKSAHQVLPRAAAAAPSTPARLSVGRGRASTMLTPVPVLAGRSSANTEQTGAGSASAAPTAAEDYWAGPVPDSALQHLLEESHSGSIHGADATSAAAVAWTYLSRDLATGRWTKVRRQAAVVAAPHLTGADAVAGAALPVADVTIMWAGTSPLGQASERHLATIRLARREQSWLVLDQQ